MPAGEQIEVELVHPRLSVEPSMIRRAALAVASGEGRRVGELSIVLADHERVLALNLKYLGHDYHTDVLSFDLSEEGAAVVEGEIYIDLDTALERHHEFETEFETEVLRYVIHGLLHLAGHEDATDDGKAKMRQLEDRYLTALGM